MGKRRAATQKPWGRDVHPQEDHSFSLYRLRQVRSTFLFRRDCSETHQNGLLRIIQVVPHNRQY